MNESVKDYLDRKSFSYKESGDHFILSICPFCGDNGEHFYINKDHGGFDCKKCFYQGYLPQLKKHMGDIAPIMSVSDMSDVEYRVLDPRLADEYHANLMSDVHSDVWTYLKGRGITNQTMIDFKLGCKVDKFGNKWLSVPYIKNGKVVNFKYRSVPPSDKKFLMEEKCEIPLFNVDIIKEHKEVWITEGELDAITLCQYGYKACSVSKGAGSKYDTDWYDALVDKHKIYLFYDADTAGQRGAKNAAIRLGGDHCYNIITPEKDANDYFRKHTLDEFKIIAESAMQMDKSRVPSMYETLIDIINMKNAEGTIRPGFRLKWKKLDTIIGPLSPGHLIGITAIPKTGKTTFCLNVLSDMAFNQKIPCLMYCLEMSPMELVLKVVSRKRKKSTEEIDSMDLELSKNEFMHTPFYFCGGNSNQTNMVIYDTIRYAVKRFGVRMVVFDNIHFLVRSIAHVSNEIGLITKEFKTLAEELGIPIIMVLQPKKVDENSLLGMYDVRDSSSIPADVDILISLFRKQLKQPRKKVTDNDYLDTTVTFDNKCIISVMAGRYTPGGSTTLQFNGAHSEFFDMDATE